MLSSEHKREMFGDVNHLETCEQRLREWVKGASFHLSIIKVEFASKQLHTQQGEDDEEEEEQKQKGADSFHRVEQWSDQIRQGSPVPKNDRTSWPHIRMGR